MAMVFSVNIPPGKYERTNKEKVNCFYSDSNIFTKCLLPDTILKLYYKSSRFGKLFFT